MDMRRCPSHIPEWKNQFNEKKSVKYDLTVYILSVAEWKRGRGAV